MKHVKWWISALVLNCLAGLASAPAFADTLVVAASRTPGGFDGDALKPGTREVVLQVYEGLVANAKKKDAEGNTVVDFENVVPHLAESWTVSPDGKEYVFNLRQGVKSAFGNELTADDVVWGWEKSEAQDRTGAFLAKVSNLVSVSEVSKYEVKFTLAAPSEVFLRALTYYVPAVYDVDEVKKHATADDPWALKWMDSNTAGFGAYHLSNLVQGQQAVFVANPNYFGGKPFYDRVVLREVPSAAARLQLLKTGQVQWAMDLTEEQVANLEKDPNFKSVSTVGTVMANYRMNAKIKPFDDIRVRQALAYATDYDTINKAIFGGKAIQAHSFFSPMIPGYADTFSTYKTDYEKAKALLGEAGYPNGIDITVAYGAELWWEEPIAIQLQQSFAKAGIRLALSRQTAADLRAGTVPGKEKFAFFPFRDSPFVLDPMYKAFIDAHPDGASNRNGYDNPQFTALVEAGLKEGDPTKRLEMAKQIQQIHADDVSWIYTFYPGFTQPLLTCMQGYAWYPGDQPRWRELSCVK